MAAIIEKSLRETCKQLLLNRSKNLGAYSDEQVPLRVLVTGAGGLVAYSMVYSLATGVIFGQEQPIILVLLDVEAMMIVLRGVSTELTDICSSLLKEVIITTDVQTAFKDIDVALLMASVNPSRPEPLAPIDDIDSLQTHIHIYKQHAEALNLYAKKTVKVVVVAEPCSTLAYVCIRYAPTISAKNFTSLTRLYQNRTIAQVSSRLNIPNHHIKNVVAWGMAASHVWPDLTHASIRIVDKWNPAPSVIQNDHWIKNELVTIIQNRGSIIFAARKISNALSTAQSVGDHLHDWWFGTNNDDWVNMGVQSDGSYGVEEGLVFGFPVRIDASRNYTIVSDLPVTDFVRHRIDITVKECIRERDEAIKRCIELESVQRPQIN